MKRLITLGTLLLATGVFAGNRPIWKGRAVLIIKKNKVEAFKRAVSKIIAPTLKEKGCISYEGFQVLDKNGDETNRFEFHELWISKDAMMIDHKENSKHMKKFFKEIKIDTKDSFVESFEVDGAIVIQLK